MSLRDKIVAVSDIGRQTVEIPEWGVTVEVRGLTARQRAILFKNCTDAKGKVDLQQLHPHLVILCTYDPATGGPVFEAGDADMLAERSAKAIDRIAEVAQELSGLSVEDAEEAEKN